MIVGERAGFMINIGKPEQIADKIKGILNDEDLRKRLRGNALKAVSKWSYEEDIEGLLSALDFIYSNKE